LTESEIHVQPDIWLTEQGVVYAYGKGKSEEQSAGKHKVSPMRSWPPTNGRWMLTSTALTSSTLSRACVRAPCGAVACAGPLRGGLSCGYAANYKTVELDRCSGARILLPAGGEPENFDVRGGIYSAASSHQ